MSARSAWVGQFVLHFLMTTEHVPGTFLNRKLTVLVRARNDMKNQLAHIEISERNTKYGILWIETNLSRFAHRIERLQPQTQMRMINHSFVYQFNHLSMSSSQVSPDYGI